MRACLGAPPESPENGAASLAENAPQNGARLLIRPTGRRYFAASRNAR